MNSLKSTEKIRIDSLVEFINQERHLYHKNNGEGMSVSPEVLDSLKHELSGLEEKHPDLIREDSPTQTIA